MIESELVKRIVALEREVERLRTIEKTAWCINQTLSAPSASIDIPNLPQYARNLRIVASLRTDRAGQVLDNIGLRFQGDSGNNYVWQVLYGITAAVTASQTVTTDKIHCGNSTGATATAGYFGQHDILVSDYTASKEKIVTCHNSVWYTSGATNAMIFGSAGAYTVVGAVTQITLISFNGANFIAGSRVTIYGE